MKATLDVPMGSMDELMRAAVRAVPGAILIEVLPEEALVGRRTNFATRAETTRFRFVDHGAGGVEVVVAATNGLVLGIAGPVPEAVLETGRAVFDALVRFAREAVDGDATGRPQIEAAVAPAPRRPSPGSLPARRDRAHIQRVDYAILALPGLLTGAAVTFGQLWFEAGATVIAVVPLGLLALCLIWGAAILLARANHRRRR